MKPEPLKKTLLLSMPRVGSLAMSIIFNTDECLAHHEGMDYKNIRPGIMFNETAAYGMSLIAAQQNKNYLCCDTGLVPMCLANAFKTDAGKRGFIQGGWQILVVTRDIADITRSMANSLYERPNTLQLIAVRLATDRTWRALQALMNEVSTALPTKRLLHIHKKERHFNKTQLTCIADFVGSGYNYIGSLGGANISMSREQLEHGAKVIDEAYEGHIKEMDKKNPTKPNTHKN
jgi:hypothetical protein